MVRGRKGGAVKTRGEQGALALRHASAYLECTLDGAEGLGCVRPSVGRVVAGQRVHVKCEVGACTYEHLQHTDSSIHEQPDSCMREHLAAAGLDVPATWPSQMRTRGGVQGTCGSVVQGIIAPPTWNALGEPSRRVL